MIVLGALAFALAGVRAPGYKGLLAFIPAILILVFGMESTTLTIAALGCGILALFRAPSALPRMVCAGILAMSPVLFPWIEPAEDSVSVGLFAFAFSLFLSEGVERVKKSEKLRDERWFALACSFLTVGLVVWMWDNFLRGNSVLGLGPWAVSALLGCAFVVGGWHRSELGAELLALIALAGLWFLAV